MHLVWSYFAPLAPQPAPRRGSMQQQSVSLQRLLSCPGGGSGCHRVTRWVGCGGGSPDTVPSTTGTPPCASYRAPHPAGERPARRSGGGGSSMAAAAAQWRRPGRRRSKKTRKSRRARTGAEAGRGAARRGWGGAVQPDLEPDHAFMHHAGPAVTSLAANGCTVAVPAAALAAAAV